MRVRAGLGCVAVLVVAGCASSAGQPWKDIRVGMTDEAAINLGRRPSSIAEGEEGAVVWYYPDGGSVTVARDPDGEWRVASFRRP